MKLQRTIWVGGALLLATALLVTGCKDNSKEGAAPSATAATAAASAAAGSDACDQYVAALDACIGKLDKAAASSLEKTRDAQKEALKAAQGPAREQMLQGCSMGLAALKQNGLCN